MYVSELEIAPYIIRTSLFYLNRLWAPAKYIVGLEIHWDRVHRTLHLNQHKYTLDMLKRFNMKDCNPLSTPLDHGCCLSKDLCPQPVDEELAMKNIPYLAAVGSLNFLAIGTRPDLAHAVGELGQFNLNPCPGHWKVVQHVLKYLKGTADLGLTYSHSNPDSQCMLQAYCDANYTGDEDRRRSTTGYAFFIGGACCDKTNMINLFFLSTYNKRLKTPEMIPTQHIHYVSCVHMM